MRCFLTFTIAAALAAGITTTSWSQTGGAGGTAGGASSAGAAGGTSAAGTSNASNAAAANAQAGGTNGNGAAVGTANGVGTAGNAGAAGNAGTAGTAGRAGAAGVNANGNRAGAANGVNGRVDGSSAQRNTGAGLGANGNVNGNANGNGFFNGVSQTPFFGDSGARRQLNLNDTQYNSLNQGYQNAYSRYSQAVNNLDPNLTEQQRDSQLQQLQAQFNQNLSGTVNNTVTNPQNQARFNQLNRQYNGFNAFNDPTVRRQLNLSPDQIRQLRTLSGNWRQQMQQFRRNGANAQGSADPAQWTQMQQQFATQLNGVLTPEQQQMWSQQTGQPYTFSPDAYFGGQSGNAATGTQRQGNVGTGTNNPVFQPDNRGAQTRGPNQQVTPQGTATPGTANPGTGTQGGTAQGTQGGTVR